MDGVIIKNLERYSDERGWLAEVFRSDELSVKPAMAYVSLTKPGIIRGPHEHRRQTDVFVFLGPGDFELYLWDNRPDSATYKEAEKIMAGEDNPSLIIVPPGVVHGYKCVSDVDAFCFNFPDTLYRGEGKAEEVDEIRWENQADAPYKIE
jgi:dTDP-4-dehydrorhamnose 3,5-epimerase